jgi:rhamnose utilization protein RhaD (predicted bifunctional aldolase and dehydrogenase)
LSSGSSSGHSSKDTTLHRLFPRKLVVHTVNIMNEILILSRQVKTHLLSQLFGGAIDARS